MTENKDPDDDHHSEEETRPLTDEHYDHDLEDLMTEESTPDPKENEEQSVNHFHGATTSSSSLQTLLDYTTLLCQAHFRLCVVLGLIGIVGIVLIFSDWAFNPTEFFGTIQHDYSSIHSASELKVANIDHWCIDGSNDKCACEDPLEPQPRLEFKSWTKAHMLNKNMVATASSDNVNVAFLGSSVVEEMAGRWMGLQPPSLKSVEQTFHKHFDNDGKIKAVALGVAGDASPNVLWRFLNGEGDLNPKIWWLSLGMNDLARMKCSEEVVVMGILNVVERLLETKPNAKIVINSLLPMAELRGGVYPKPIDFKDAMMIRNNKKMGGTTSLLRDSSFVRANNNNNNRALRRQDDTTTISKKDIRQFEKKIKHDRINPKMDEFQTKMKKYNALRFHKNRLPLWTSIVAINRELRDYSRKHDDRRVEFFDATSLFTEPSNNNGQDVLLSNMISIRGHPTQAGYKVWQDAVKDKLENMLKDN